MKKILLSILCVSLYACQESKPAEPEVTQEEQEQKMAAERFEALGKDLDENPSFKECEDIATKDEKLKCFTGTSPSFTKKCSTAKNWPSVMHFRIQLK